VGRASAVVATHIGGCCPADASSLFEFAAPYWRQRRAVLASAGYQGLGQAA
jgi:hypothetical protein